MTDNLTLVLQDITGEMSLSGNVSESLSITDGNDIYKGAIAAGMLRAVISRTSFTEADWERFGTYGRAESWTPPAAGFYGCRIGDIFVVQGTSTDTGTVHVLWFASTAETASNVNLRGICIAHTITKLV